MEAIKADRRRARSVFDKHGDGWGGLTTLVTGCPYVSFSMPSVSFSSALTTWGLLKYGDSEMTDRVRLVGRYSSCSAISRHFEVLLCSGCLSRCFDPECTHLRTKHPT